jgi:AcrR family transcriptional regulator
MTEPVPPLQPRKKPQQARSVVTLAAIGEAAIQVLLAEGIERTTTTRVAARAGVSVGSLYQYFPDKRALLAAVLAQHLTSVAMAVEQSCMEQRGGTVAEMAQALVRAYVGAKLEHARASKALYAIAAGHGGAERVELARERMLAAVSGMLATAGDRDFVDPSRHAAIILGAIAGPVRNLLESNRHVMAADVLQEELVTLARAYLNAVSAPC